MNAKFLKNWIFFLVALLFAVNVLARDATPQDVIAVSDLPVDAQRTLALIRQGGPFPFSKDGAVFGNYERALPRQGRGYYHEYTVKTPGARNRGARRIIVGGQSMSSRDRYFTDNHYASFKRIKE